MFVGLYIVILCLSTGIAVWVMTRAAYHLRRVVHHEEWPVPAGLLTLLPAIAFLMVVAAPGPVLVGALVLLATQTAVRFNLCVAFCRMLAPLFIVALCSVVLPLPSLMTLPGLALNLAVTLGWYGVTMSGQKLPASVEHSTLALIASLFPLLAAPLFFHAPGWIALDVALLLCACFAAHLAHPDGPTLGIARLPLGFLSGWLMVECALRGGWIPAAISALAWAGFLAYGFQHRAPEPTRPAQCV